MNGLSSVLNHSVAGWNIDFVNADAIENLFTDWPIYKVAGAQLEFYQKAFYFPSLSQVEGRY